MEVGDNLTISDVELPSGAKPTIDRDFVIAQVSAPSSLKSSEDEEADGEGEGEEGEATEAEANAPEEAAAEE